MQLKEWGYEKYLRKSEAALITAKTQKQSREEAQEAVFFHGEVTISYERITNFKLRTLSCRDSGNDPEGPRTPERTSYSSPIPVVSEEEAAYDFKRRKISEMTIAPISSELDAQARCRYAKLCSDDSGGDSSSKETLDIKATSALQSQALSTPQAKPAQGTLPPLGGHLLQAWEILGELEVIFGFGRQKNIDYTTVNWERYAIVPKQQAIGFQSFIASCVCLLALSANAMGILATKKLRLPSMCPERKAQLRRTLYVLEKIKKKVQQWLHSGVPLIGQPDSALPPVTAFRSIRARDHVLRLQEAVKLMSFALDEIGNVEVLAEQPSSIVEEPTGVQDASVVEVNVEVDECLSISTKIRSSKYGVTYTESLASGITFDYTALFPGPRC